MSATKKEIRIIIVRASNKIRNKSEMSERCFNHPEKPALNICHSCNQYFCEECLIAGEEFYYCNKEKCQSMLNEEKINTDQEKSEIIDTLRLRNKIFYKRVFISPVSASL